MAVPSGTFTKYAAIGMREDLSDMIYDISSTDRPFMSNVKRGKATGVFHEWQTDALTAATALGTVEGTDAVVSTASATTRFGNYTMIISRTPSVSGTLDAVNKAGRKTEMSYQIAKRGKEVANSIEKALCGIQAATHSTAALARVCAGIGSWLWNNNTKKGTAAASTTIAVTSGAPSTSPTESSVGGTFVEADLKSVIADCWDDGGDPDLVLLGSHNKALASGFSGIATQYKDNNNSPATIIGAADVYISNFGEHKLVASRLVPTNNVYVLDTEYWSVDYLRPIQQKQLAKTGDSEKRQILAEFTLKASNPSSSGKIYATTTS